MIAALKRRAEEEHDGDVLAYASDWLKDGKSIAKLAVDLKSDLSFEPSRSFVAAYIASLREDAAEVIRLARAEGAHAMMERAQIRTDEVRPERDDIARVKLQNEMDGWLAERWNKQELGQAKQAEVTINIAHLMLQALEAPAPAPIAIASAIAQDAIDVTIEEPTT